MEYPAEEVVLVVKLLTAASSPDVQKAAIERYFVPDAGFRHPLCAVESGPNSRKALLGIYQWYRVISPRIEIDIHHVSYDSQANVLYLEAEQKFHIRFSPFSPFPSRLIVRLTLREISGRHYISLQEDFYHPEDITALVIPPLIPVVRIVLVAAGMVSDYSARIAQMFGFWKPA